MDVRLLYPISLSVSAMQMTRQTRSEGSFEAPLPFLLISEGQARIPELQPRPDGIRCARGVLLGVVLCLPIWAFVWWMVASRF